MFFEADHVGFFLSLEMKVVLASFTTLIMQKLYQNGVFSRVFAIYEFAFCKE